MCAHPGMWVLFRTQLSVFVEETERSGAKRCCANQRFLALFTLRQAGAALHPRTRSQLRILTMSDAWHWTSKDVTQITKAALSVALEAPPLLSAASPLLHGCRLSSIRMAGDCSVHARKGRRFLLYELKLECVWRGGKDGADASGSLQLPDLSPECLDDLAIEFTTDCPGTPLSEAMRKLGVPAIRRAVQSCIRTLELKVAEADATPKVALPSAGPSVSSSASGTGGAAPGPGTGEGRHRDREIER